MNDLLEPNWKQNQFLKIFQNVHVLLKFTIFISKTPYGVPYVLVIYFRDRREDDSESRLCSLNKRQVFGKFIELIISAGNLGLKIHIYNPRKIKHVVWFK